MANSGPLRPEESLFWLEGTALAHSNKAYFRWGYIYWRVICTQNQIVCYDPTITKKEKQTFPAFGIHYNILGK